MDEEPDKHNGKHTSAELTQIAGDKQALYPINAKFQGNAHTRQLDYEVSNQSALQKKLAACARSHISVSSRDNINFIIELSTAAFELCRTALYKVTHIHATPSRRPSRNISHTLDKDANGSIIAETIEIKNWSCVARATLNGLKGTCKIIIHIYRTTSRCLVNGAHSRPFIELFLPALRAHLDENTEEYDLRNAKIQMAIENSKIILDNKKPNKLNEKRSNRSVGGAPARMDKNPRHAISHPQPAQTSPDGRQQTLRLEQYAESHTLATSRTQSHPDMDNSSLVKSNGQTISPYCNDRRQQNQVQEEIAAGAEGYTVTSMGTEKRPENPNPNKRQGQPAIQATAANYYSPGTPHSQLRLEKQCKRCKNEARNKSAICHICLMWAHYECENLRIDEINQLEEGKPFICKACNVTQTLIGLQDYTQGKDPAPSQESTQVSTLGGTEADIVAPTEPDTPNICDYLVELREVHPRPAASPGNTQTSYTCDEHCSHKMELEKANEREKAVRAKEKQLQKLEQTLLKQKIDQTEESFQNASLKALVSKLEEKIRTQDEIIHRLEIHLLAQKRQGNHEQNSDGQQPRQQAPQTWHHTQQASHNQGSCCSPIMVALLTALLTQHSKQQNNSSYSCHQTHQIQELQSKIIRLEDTVQKLQESHAPQRCEDKGHLYDQGWKPHNGSSRQWRDGRDRRQRYQPPHRRDHMYNEKSQDQDWRGREREERDSAETERKVVVFDYGHKTNSHSEGLKENTEEERLEAEEFSGEWRNRQSTRQKVMSPTKSSRWLAALEMVENRHSPTNPNDEVLQEHMHLRSDQPSHARDSYLDMEGTRTENGTSDKPLEADRNPSYHPSQPFLDWGRKKEKVGGCKDRRASI